MQTIADRIELMLAERRITKAELAKKSGVPKQTIQSIIEVPNRSPRADTIQKLAVTLDVDHSWLATGKHSKSKELTDITEQDRDDIAQALEDAIAERGLTRKIGAAEKSALIAAFVAKLQG